MTQHYTRDTVSVAAWCKACGGMTMHTVSDRRLGYCIPCYEKPLPATPAPPPPEPGLFDE
jgi:hypothetical protein